MLSTKSPCCKREQAAPPPLGRPDTAFALSVTGIVVLSLATYLALSAGWPKFSRAEVFFAECAREMIAAGTMVTPLYHGAPFFDKPALTYWLIIAAFEFLGPSHFAARIPSVMAAGVTLVTTALASCYLFGPRAGIIACFVLASSLMFVSFAALCMSDMLLVMFDTLALALAYAGIASERRRGLLFALASLAMGLGFLTKGPVALVLPGAAVLAYLALTGKWHVLRPIHLLISLSILVASAGPWFYAVYAANGPGALSYFFLGENIQRFTGSRYDTHRPPWFMAGALLGGFAPWSVFLPVALIESLRSIRGGVTSAGPRGFLWLWIAIVIGFFSLSRGKIGYYALPAFPAAACLVASCLAPKMESRPFWLILLLAATGGVLVGGSLLAIDWLPRIVESARWQDCLLVPLALCLSGAGMLMSALRKRLMTACLFVFLCVCFSSLALAWQMYPQVTRMQGVLGYVAHLRSLPCETRVGVDAELKRWVDEIVFQTGREPLKLSSPASCAHFLIKSRDAVLLVTRRTLCSMEPSALEKLVVLDSRPFISHQLNPGYIFRRRGRLVDDQLLLVRRRSSM